MVDAMSVDSGTGCRHRSIGSPYPWDPHPEPFDTRRPTSDHERQEIEYDGVVAQLGDIFAEAIFLLRRPLSYICAAIILCAVFGSISIMFASVIFRFPGCSIPLINTVLSCNGDAKQAASVIPDSPMTFQYERLGARYNHSSSGSQDAWVQLHIARQLSLARHELKDIVMISEAHHLLGSQDKVALEHLLQHTSEIEMQMLNFTSTVSTTLDG